MLNSSRTKRPLVISATQRSEQMLLGFITEADVKKKFDSKEEIPDQLQHLSHHEDRIIQNGEVGFKQATESLQKTHDFLNGKSPKDFTVTEKYDGSPAIIVGHDPVNGSYFISTKSIFNKTPKISYTLDDIEKNYSHAPGLVTKLKQAFVALQDSIPKKGVFQGDLMYSADDVKHEGSKVSFTPNTITYSASKDTPAGKRVANTKLGVVMHTEYKGVDLNSLKASFKLDQKKFTNTGAVNFIDPTVNTKDIKYTPEDEKKFAHNMMKARELHDQMKKGGLYDIAQGQEPLMLTYINNAIRKKKNGNLAGYLGYVETRYKKELENLKTDKNKAKKKEQMDELVAHIMDNKHGIEDFFKLHTLLADTKNIFVHALSTTKNDFSQSINGVKSKPEGFVSVNNGAPLKLVDRMDFSSANFAKNSPVTLTDPTDKPVVFTYGRMNPPHAGHAAVIQKVKDEAKRIGATAKIVATSSHDPEKNPLSPKLHQAWLDKMFPDDKVEVAGDDAKTMIAQLKKLHQNGTRQLTVVVGDDRKKEFESLINRYNGKPDMWNFRKIDIVSAGKRDDKKAEDLEGVSGTRVREAAKKNDFKTFHKMMPKGTKENDSHRMFDDVRRGMGVVDIKDRAEELKKKGEAAHKAAIQIGPQTPGWSLSTYAKRTTADRVGSLARMEINRRKRAGTWKGKQ